MLKVIFKNVGQGDAIYCEYQKDKIDRIGIIDCNASIAFLPEDYFNSRNAVKKGAVKRSCFPDIIKSKGFNDIDFLVISHPHSDHYSGLESLLEFCQQENVQIKKIYHTFEVLRLFKLSIGDFNRKQRMEQIERYFGTLQNFDTVYNLFDLVNLYESEIKNLNELPVIESSAFIDSSTFINMNEALTFRFLSPSAEERKRFISKSKESVSLVSIEDDDNLINLLSTIMAINVGDNFVLLNSDAVPFSFDRILESITDDSDYKTTLIQVPHHGSSNNFSYKYFEFIRSKTKDKCISIISCGKDNKHRHPSESVIEELIQLNYDIHSTNYTHGLEKYFPEDSLKSQFNGDQVFIIDENGISYLES